MCSRHGLGYTICFAGTQTLDISRIGTQAQDMEFTITYYKRRLNDDESASSRSRSSIGGSEEKEYPYFEFDAS